MCWLLDSKAHRAAAVVIETRKKSSCAAIPCRFSMIRVDGSLDMVKDKRDVLRGA